MVLDPFCGCATTMVAAERLDRQWAGIDPSPLAVKLVVKSLQQAADEEVLFKGGRVPDVYLPRGHSSADRLWTPTQTREPQKGAVRRTRRPLRRLR